MIPNVPKRVKLSEMRRPAIEAAARKEIKANKKKDDKTIKEITQIKVVKDNSAAKSIAKIFAETQLRLVAAARNKKARDQLRLFKGKGRRS